MVHFNYLDGHMVMRSGVTMTKLRMGGVEYHNSLDLLRKRFPDRPFYDETMPASMNPREEKVEGSVMLEGQAIPKQLLRAGAIEAGRRAPRYEKIFGGKRRHKIKGSQWGRPQRFLKGGR